MTPPNKEVNVKKVSLRTIIRATKILARKLPKGTRQVKAWAVLDGKELEIYHPKSALPPEYWIFPKKPHRKEYHPDYTFVPCTITYKIHAK